MINYKKTYKESTSWRHWRLSCLYFYLFISLLLFFFDYILKKNC